MGIVATPLSGTNPAGASSASALPGSLTNTSPDTSATRATLPATTGRLPAGSAVSQSSGMPSPSRSGCPARQGSGGECTTVVHVRVTAFAVSGRPAESTDVAVTVSVPAPAPAKLKVARPSGPVAALPVVPASGPALTVTATLRPARGTPASVSVAVTACAAPAGAVPVCGPRESRAAMSLHVNAAVAVRVVPPESAKLATTVSVPGAAPASANV